MARNEELSDNELDEFDAKREKVLLDEAGSYYNDGGSSAEEESEEEVMSLKNQNQESDLEEEEEGEEGEEGEEEEEAGVEGWGSKKNYYGGDDISDDEDGKEMAEEALRQQKKHLQDLEMDDFVDEEMLEGWKKTAKLHDAHEATISGAVVEEKTIDLASLEDDEKLKLLKGSFPEFIPLLKEFNSLEPKLVELKNTNSNVIVEAKLSALTAYLGAISSYFAIFADNLRTQDNFSMKDSPVMEAILSAREVWRQAGELNFTVHEKVEDEAQVMDVEVSESESDTQLEDRIQTDLEEEEDIEDEEEEDERRDIELDVTTKRAIKKVSNPAAGDYTETNQPDSVDKEEKERRKKSLRFYTSKIDQAAQKSARNDKFNGDLDLPYRERLFERQQRLVEEARKRGLGLDKAQLGESLGDEDMNDEDQRLAGEINEDAEDYYESVKQGKIAKKEDRRAAHEAAKRAAREGTLADMKESVGKDGKRALNFQILKNKGLTPNRRNENRNARVKKRKKYEQAKKKLKSVRQVYDQSNSGPYQGEKTGIKKGVSRSVKLI